VTWIILVWGTVHCKSGGSQIETCPTMLVFKYVKWDFSICYLTINFDGLCGFFAYWLGSRSVSPFSRYSTVKPLVVDGKGLLWGNEVKTNLEDYSVKGNLIYSVLAKRYFL